MVLRIVRMHFKNDCIDDFNKLFNKTYLQIRNFNGCRFLELHKDDKDEPVFYTISKWDNAEMLENYRNSKLFRDTWAITKTYFSNPPIAYSLNKVIEDTITPF